MLLEITNDFCALPRVAGDCLTDKEGIVAAKMKIVLSLIPGSGDDIKDFMKRVDDDVSHMSSLPSSLSTIWQILKSTKAIMDRVSQVVFQV